MSATLTKQEQTRLLMLEEVLERTADAVESYKEALVTILAERLYRGVGTWDEYCQQAKWFQKTGRHGRRIVAWVVTGAEIKAVNGPMGPKNERQSRELDPLETAEEKAEVMEEVAAEGEVTAEKIKGKVQDRLRGKSAAQKLAIVQEEENAALLNQQRGYIRQGVRQLARAHQVLSRVGPEVEQDLETLEALIGALCDKGETDRPKLGPDKGKGKKRAA